MVTPGQTEGSKADIDWPWVLWCTYLYILGIYGLYHLIASSMWLTMLFAMIMTTCGYLGLTIGAHRLWAHKTYEAKWYIKLFLMLAHTLAGIGPIYDWVLVHRLHHKFYGTEQDPYNHNKGFLYSHVIANLKKNSAEYEKLAKVIDMRDMESDTFVWLQRKFYMLLFLIFGLLLPINAPVEYWGESITTSLFVVGTLRLAILLNISWLINSASHIWNLKPQDKNPPDDNSVFLINKTYWLSYHYLLPWDWKNGEFGSYDKGFSTSIIRVFKALGFAKHLTTASNDSIRQALFSLASTKTSANEVFNDVKKIADYKSTQANLHYHH